MVYQISQFYYWFFDTTRSNYILPIAFSSVIFETRIVSLFSLLLDCLQKKKLNNKYQKQVLDTLVILSLDNTYLVPTFPDCRVVCLHHWDVSFQEHSHCFVKKFGLFTLCFFCLFDKSSIDSCCFAIEVLN